MALLLLLWAQRQDFLGSRLAGDFALGKTRAMTPSNPLTPCPLGPGPAGFWRQCGLLPSPSCAQEDLVSPAGSAGGGKERQDAQVPGGRRLPTTVV